MNTKQKEIEKILYQEFKTFILSQSQVGVLINKSIPTLSRWRKQGKHLEYSKSSEAATSPIEYTIFEIAKYIVSNNIKVN